jgi:hypothetical protein
MGLTGQLDALRALGRLRWMQSADAWTADPGEVVSALARDGFEECKWAEARDPRHHARGGVWQGLNRDTGAVASAVWICGDARGHLVFIDIDGEPVRESGGASDEGPIGAESRHD